ncbi:putative poly(A)-specific ribonuclease [Lupinus albus]|uniref:poly(A)-specific ribonuclease n=1 Tax=Lupinus albus TaxID=3870 RepID=A0A6A4QE59_LUPAL|nr:putative poly(A)-specific ribonuclease [Lupinus albus]
MEPNMKPLVVRHVWAYNLVLEFYLITKLIPRYSFIAMDTQFPGYVFHYPTTESYNHRNLTPSDNYSFLKVNVDALKLIQVGFTLSDAAGNLPDLGTKNRYIWQFNFRDFNLARDIFAPDSIALLHRQGIKFGYNANYGIHSAYFGHLMISYGLLYSYNLTWLTFHGSHDFGYLIKIITRCPLPKFRRVLMVCESNVR